MFVVQRLEQTGKSSGRFIWGWGRWKKPQVPDCQRCRDGGMGPGPLVRVGHPLRP